MVKKSGSRGHGIGRLNTEYPSDDIHGYIGGETVLEREHSAEFWVSMAGMGLTGFSIH